MKRNFKKICVLKGGFSTEREISLLSGSGMADAARFLGYDVSEFDFTGNVYALLAFLKAENPDCIINGLHGAGGEDGNIQSVLNFLKIPYTHSGVLASSIAMNKYASGLIFNQNGVRTPKSRKCDWRDFKDNLDFPLPFVIKPVNEGSSCGVYIIKKFSDLDKVNWAYRNEVYISEYIPGLELSVGVLSGRALEVTNIIVESSFYDYKSKYTKGRARHEIPANISPKIRKEALESAEKIHKLLGCRGVSRTDFRYNDVTDELFALEINTQPGMSPLSLVPEQARHVGISFEELTDRLIQEAAYDEM